ncbi:MAG: WecB/TagA/CpsF family glycosyltransferase [Bacteroidota bacterium]
MNFLKDRFVGNGRLTVIGTAFSIVNMRSAVEHILGWGRQRNSIGRFVCVSGVHGVIEAEHDESFRSILNNADLNVPDGVPIVWIGKLCGFDKIGRVFGPDLMLEVCKESAMSGCSHFFYGGNEGVAAELAGRMERCYPGMKIAGTYCPPFRELSETEQSALVDIINKTSPDILWVGLSTPKQERWISQMKGKLKVGVMLGVGAAFDYNTGRLQRAPGWMQVAGLEWLYRLIQEPRRLYLRYLINNPKFLVLVAGQMLGIKKSF